MGGGIITKRQIPKEIKKAVFIRDHGECQMCGWMKDGEYHHVYEWRKEHEHDVWNLMFLCRGCHDIITPNKYLVKTSESKDQVKDMLLSILCDSIPVPTKVSKLEHWTRTYCKKNVRSELLRICKYFRWIINSPYHFIELSYYKKANGDIILKWDVSLEEL